MHLTSRAAASSWKAASQISYRPGYLHSGCWSAFLEMLSSSWLDAPVSSYCRHLQLHWLVQLAHNVTERNCPASRRRGKCHLRIVIGAAKWSKARPPGETGDGDGGEGGKLSSKHAYSASRRDGLGVDEVGKSHPPKAFPVPSPITFPLHR